MNYEVIHGDYVRIVTAGNPHQACLMVLREEARDDNIQSGSFSVLPLTFEAVAQEIDMAEIVAIQHVSVNGEEPEGKSTIDIDNLPDDFWDWG